MLKCNIVRDLLPIYIDELTSKETESEVQKHLQECSECNEILKELKTPIENIDLKTENSEINYLKRIKVKNAKKLGIIIGSILLAFTVLSYLFVIGSPVEMKDMKYTQRVVNGEVLIDFELINGKELNMKTSEVVDPNSGKLTKIIIKPHEVIKSPISGGKTFMFGYEDKQFEVIIQFADKEVIVSNDVLGSL